MMRVLYFILFTVFITVGFISESSAKTEDLEQHIIVIHSGQDRGVSIKIEKRNQPIELHLQSYKPVDWIIDSDQENSISKIVFYGSRIQNFKGITTVKVEYSEKTLSKTGGNANLTPDTAQYSYRGHTFVINDDTAKSLLYSKGEIKDFRSLSKNANVVVIASRTANYTKYTVTKSSTHTNHAHINLSGLSKPISLVLLSSENVIWHIYNPDNSIIASVVVNDTRSGVTGDPFPDRRVRGIQDDTVLVIAGKAMYNNTADDAYTNSYLKRLTGAKIFSYYYKESIDEVVVLDLIKEKIE
jgi:hypothetical protein